MTNADNLIQNAQNPGYSQLHFVIVIDESGLILHASPSVFEVLNLESNQLLSKKYSQINLPDNLVGIIQSRQKIIFKKGGVSEFAYPLVLDEAPRWFRWKMSQLGTMAGLLVLIEASLENHHQFSFDQDIFELMSIPMGTLNYNAELNEYVFEKVNDEFSLLFEMGKGEFIGARLKHIFLDSGEQIKKSLNKLKESRSTVEESVFISETDRHFDLYFVPVGQDRALLHIKDVTAQKKLEEGLRTDRDTLMAITSLLPTGILVFDKKARISFANKRAQMIFGQERSIIGKKLHDPHLHVHDIKGWPISDNDSCIETILRDKKSIDGYKYIIGSEKNSLHVLIHGEPIVDDRGEVKSIILVIEDMSKEIAYQSKLEKNIEEKQILLHEMNHRVKNNLAVILSVIKMQALVYGEENSQLKALEGRIYAIGLLHAMLFDPKRSQKIGADQYIIQLLGHIHDSYITQDVDICSHISNIPANLTPEFLNIIGLICNELVTNSFKYAFRQGAKNNVVEISLRTEDNNLLLTVEDNGKGFPESLIAQTSTNNQVESGKGINLVLMLTSGVKGRLLLQNKPNGGALVRVNLPLKSN